MLKITTVQFIVFCLAAADFSFPPKNSARPHTPQGRIRKREVEVQIAGRVARKHREMRLFCGNDCPILWPERRNDRYINGLEGSWGEVKLRSEVVRGYITFDTVATIEQRRLVFRRLVDL